MRISDWSSDVCSSDLVDDRHVESGGDRMIEEDAVHRAAHRLVTAKAERQVRQAAREMDVRNADADDIHRLAELNRINVIPLHHPRDPEGNWIDKYRKRVGSGKRVTVRVKRGRWSK